VKRIAAVAALIITMLAVPAAAAMASTSGSVSGSAGQGQYACQPYYGQHHHHGRHHKHHKHHKHHRHHRHHGFGQGNCPFPGPPYPPYPPYQPYQQYCQGQSFTFDEAAGSNSFYETSGPELFAGETYTYDGVGFTIGTANPVASSYTDTTSNNGPNIIDGTGYLCSG
jgi:hypothetical protein